MLNYPGAESSATASTVSPHATHCFTAISHNQGNGRIAHSFHAFPVTTRCEEEESVQHEATTVDRCAALIFVAIFCQMRIIVQAPQAGSDVGA